jgi:hypothetical protein
VTKDQSQVSSARRIAGCRAPLSPIRQTFFNNTADQPARSIFADRIC